MRAFHGLRFLPRLIRAFDISSSSISWLSAWRKIDCVASEATLKASNPIRSFPWVSERLFSNLLNESAILAAREDQKNISVKQIDAALERITMGVSTSTLQDSSKKRLIAYHEIGHALVAQFTP